MNDFTRVRNLADNVPLTTLDVASATVITAGRFVTLDAGGLAIEAVSASTAIAYCPGGSLAGEVTVSVINSKDVVFEGTSSAVFAKADRGTTGDLIAAGGAQTFNTAASTTGVLKVIPDEDAGVVGETPIKVTINNTL